MDYTWIMYWLPIKPTAGVPTGLPGLLPCIMRVDLHQTFSESILLEIIEHLTVIDSTLQYPTLQYRSVH